MKRIEELDIGFLYAEPRSIISSLISYKTKGYFSHCFFVYQTPSFIIDDYTLNTEKLDFLIIDSSFPSGVKIRNIKVFRNRIIEFYRVKMTLNQRFKVYEFLDNNLNSLYDIIYYLGYLLKIKKLEIPVYFTCNELIYYALRYSGIELKYWKTPTELTFNKELKYIQTIKVI